jgi:methionine synthase I (cobalamin-dependent)
MHLQPKPDKPQICRVQGPTKQPASAVARRKWSWAVEVLMIYALRTAARSLNWWWYDLLLVETILTRWMLKRHFCYRRSKRRAQYWYSNHGVRNDYGCVRNTFRSNRRGFSISISHIPLLSVGFNCALGADQLKPYLKELAHIPHLIFTILMQDYLMPLRIWRNTQSKCRCLLKSI